MGNSQSIYIYAVDDSRSITLDKLQEITDSENRKVWKNPLTGEQYQQLVLSLNKTKSLQAQIINFERRRQQEIGLPIVHYIQNLINQDSFNRENNQFRVFVEFLPVRLNQISTIPLYSALYFLQKAFIGFGGLFNQVGYFDIKQEFIGINKNHQPKFWFNSSWAQNQPQLTTQSASNTVFQEGLMVKKIFQIIEQHIDKQQIHYYCLQKQKIKQWTFQLASLFILQFSQQHCIHIPNKISYNLKNTQSQTQKYYWNQTARKQFYVKNPKYSMMINIPEPTNYQITDRISTSKNMFKSIYHNNNDNNQFLNVKNEQVYSPKSTGQRPKFFGLNFKQSFCNNSRNKSARNQNSITKSYLALSKIVKGMNTSQRKQKLDNKVKQLKQSKHQGDKQFTSSRRKHSHFTTSFTNKNQASYQLKSFVADQKQQKYQMSQQFIHKFREGKDKNNKQFNKKGSLNQENQKHCQTNNVRKREDTNYSSTLASSQLHSPTNKQRLLTKNYFANADKSIPFFQSIKQPMTNSNQIKKQQKSFLLRGASTKQSDYQKPQLKTQVSDFCSEDDKQKSKITVLTESIVLDQMVVKSSSITDRPLLGMLDQLVMKKAIQKVEGEFKEQQYLSMKNSNAMTHSIIEHF